MATAQVEAATVQSACSGRARRAANWTTLGGALAALGVCLSCCLLPVVLITLGAGTTLVGTFNAFAPFKWYFAAVAAGLLAYAFYSVYRRPACGAKSCTKRRPGRTLKISLWAATLLAIASIVFEYLESAL